MTTSSPSSSFLDPDRALQWVMGSFIRTVGVKTAFPTKAERWQPGKPLKLLLAGYVGNRNTGADVRVEEMIRQFRHILGDEQVDLTIMTLDKALTSGYFRRARQIVLPQIFPKFLYKECPQHHGVVACEGSMFKSKFADALSTMMAGALGLAASERKLSVGYGAEAGAMSPGLHKFVQHHCKDSLVICRNEPSRTILGDLGIRTTGGTDTAWTFYLGPLERGAQLLRSQGWDGIQQTLVICPINPFWWPVKPRLMKAAARKLSNRYQEEHYKSIYFHEWSEQDRKSYHAYLDGLAEAVVPFCEENSLFPVLVGMERLDRKACQDLATRFPQRPPMFVSDEHDMYALVSLLRNCSLMVSSRFHAMVCSMPAQVPSVGVTMDERIRNLMHDRGHDDLFLQVDDVDLGGRLRTMLDRLQQDQEQIADEIGQAIPRQFQRMGEMGRAFMDEVVRVYPEFNRRITSQSWEAYLPPLSRDLQKLLEVYA